MELIWITQFLALHYVKRDRSSTTIGLQVLKIWYFFFSVIPDYLPLPQALPSSALKLVEINLQKMSNRNLCPSLPGHAPVPPLT